MSKRGEDGVGLKEQHVKASGRWNGVEWATCQGMRGTEWGDGATCYGMRVMKTMEWS